MGQGWYNSEIAQGAGVALIILACGFGGGAFFRGCGALLHGTGEDNTYKLTETWNRGEVQRSAFQKEEQRLEAIKELTRVYGPQMSPEAFSDYVGSLGLGETKIEWSAK